MEDGNLVLRTDAGDGTADADQRRIERTPIEIEEPRPVARDDGVAEIEVGNTIGADDEALGICLNGREGDENRPRGQSRAS